MPDYLPPSDGGFDAWQISFVAYTSANLAGLQLVAADLTPITNAQTNWRSGYDKHVAAAAAAHAAKQTKDATRHTYEMAIRPLVGRIQANPAITDAQRAALGITVPDREPTPVGPPTSRPVVVVDTRQRLAHTIGFMDESTPTRKAKPAGVRGAEIWVKIGVPAPVDPAELHFIALDTRTPYVLHFDGADAGKIAFYWLRWVNTRGEPGPWSEPASATVGA